MLTVRKIPVYTYSRIVTLFFVRMEIDMKYLFLAQAMAVLMYGYGMAMEAPEPAPVASVEHALQAEVADKPRVFITNDTNWELVVDYGQALYGSLQPFQLRIHSKEETKRIPEDPELFENLTVAPYGERWQYAQIAKPKNLMVDIKKVMEENPNMHILVTVRPSQAFSVWLGRQGGLGALFAKVVKPVEKLMTPFEFEYEAVASVEEQTPEIKRIRDAFPGVLAAIQSGKPLQARYYLDVPADASLDSIDKAYISLREKTMVRKDLNAINRKIVLRLLELAHNLLVADSELKEGSEILLAEK